MHHNTWASNTMLQENFWTDGRKDGRTEERKDWTKFIEPFRSQPGVQ